MLKCVSLKTCRTTRREPAPGGQVSEALFDLGWRPRPILKFVVLVKLFSPFPFPILCMCVNRFQTHSTHLSCLLSVPVLKWSNPVHPQVSANPLNSKNKELWERESLWLVVLLGWNAAEHFQHNFLVALDMHKFTSGSQKTRGMATSWAPCSQNRAL